MMRYEAKVRYLSIALVVLLGAWGLGEFFSPERMASRAETGSLLPGKTADVARLELGAPGSSLLLEKNSGRWTLVDGSDRLPAQGSRVEALLASLSKAGRKRPVASNKEAWKNLGLEEASAKTLKVSDTSGKVLLDLRAGGYGTTGSEIYVRFAGSDAAYTVDAALASWLGGDRGSWLDKRLFATSFDSSKAEALSVKADLVLDPSQKGASPLRVEWRFARSGEAWQSSKSPKGNLDTVSVESALRAALNLEAVDLAARFPAGAFDRVGATITLEASGGQKRLIEVGQSAGNGRFWVRATDSGSLSPLAYQVSSYSLGQILKDEASFIKK